MMERNCLILTQYRNDSDYNDFIGKYYHFPATSSKNYLNQFNSLPIEVVYYEPDKKGNGVFYGYGRIVNPPFIDKKTPDHYFVEVSDFKQFSNPVSFKNEQGEILEKLFNAEYYNYNNAVRKIIPQFLDELCLDGGILLNIKSDAHLIKVLGEQLIGSEKVGILELIKNSIDAQATFCRVRIEKVDDLKSNDNTTFEYPNYEGPIIVIEDDGVGMTKEIVEIGWLRPASTIKTNIKEKIKKEREKAIESGNLSAYDALIHKLKMEYGKRIPLGEKGVGRFATHRLGRFLELRTKTKDLNYVLVLKVDWNRFDVISDNYTDLDSIGLSLTREPISNEFKNSVSGTKLIIYGGREGFKWTEKSILDLNKAILSLNSPNPIKSGNKNKYDSFKVIFECPQIDDLPISQPYEEATPNFSFDILVNEQGVAEISELTFKHPYDKIPSEKWNDGGYDLKKYDENNKNYWKTETGNLRLPESGQFYIHMDLWYRRSEWIDLPDWKDLTDYLDEFGGMSIYRDNILIYDSKLGSETDWLGLASKHIKQGFRLSYRDFIGNLEIEQDKNYNLIDKTNREGLIQNQAFRDLATLATNAIESILLPRYINKRDEFTKLTKGVITDPASLKKIAKTNSTFISNITNSDYPFDNDPYSFFSGLWDKVEERKTGLINLESSVKELQSSIELLEEVQDKFVEQAGFGIAVAISLHEINKITSNFYHGIVQLLKSNQYDKLKLEHLKTSSDSLRSELKRLGPLRSIRNEVSSEFNVLSSIKYSHEIFERKLNDAGISFKILNPDEDFTIFGRYRTLNQVFGNLFDNSIYWLEASNKKEKLIHVLLNRNFRSIIFSDSGNDIDDIIRPYLFQAGYSLRNPPSGLGLYICKSYLNAMKGKIYETPVKDRIPNITGAHFTLDFSRTPSKQK